MSIRMILPRFWNSVLSREDGFDVPGQEAVDDCVDEQHPDASRQRVLVAGALLGAGPDVVPLSSHSLFLVVGEVGAAEPERHVGDQAL